MVLVGFASLCPVSQLCSSLCLCPHFRFLLLRCSQIFWAYCMLSLLPVLSRGLMMFLSRFLQSLTGGMLTHIMTFVCLSHLVMVSDLMSQSPAGELCAYLTWWCCHLMQLPTGKLCAWCFGHQQENCQPTLWPSVTDVDVTTGWCFQT